MNIEVELRSLISEEKYRELIEFFSKEGKFLNEDEQTTYYFDCPEDLRIQKNKFYSKIWLKKGNLHDEAREEIEIKYDKEKFEDLEKLFLSLGYGVEIKWFRKRSTFDWEGIKAMVDYTKGFGYILELEKMSDEAGKDSALIFLKQKLSDLGIQVTGKEKFDEKYEYYKKNWKDLV